MHPRAIWAIARKDALDLLLNKSTLGGLLFPILMSLIWLLLSIVIGNRTTEVLVYNPGSSNIAQVAMAALPSPEVTQASSAEEVTAAFSPNGAHKATRYAVGLVVPADFDNSVRAGTHPQLQLYLNGNTVNAQTEALIQAAITNYGRALANQQPPVDLTTTVINPPSNTNAEMELRGVYAPLALLLSLIVGTTFVPQLLIEEKEKKTLRMLMVTPASFEDILLGKLLVVLVYQLILTVVVLAILGAFTGQIALVVLYALLGGCFSLALGLLFGAVFDTVSAAAAVEGPVIIIYIIASIFVGPLGELLSNSPAIRVAKALPTYYIADGVYNASQKLGSFGSNLLDIGVILGSTIVLLVVSAWVLRRQDGSGNGLALRHTSQRPDTGLQSTLLRCAL
jgi:ABC-2 type transport system permease protein